MAEALAKYGPRGHCRVGGARPNRGATAQARRAMRHGAKQSEGVIECAVTAVLLAHEAPRRGKIVRHKPKWGISPVAELLSHLRGTISGWGHLRRFGVKSNFLSPINVIWAVQSHSKNILIFRNGKSLLYPPPSCPTGGAARDRHGRGTGCGGRKGRQRRGRFSCGRRSRVVLTPRRWRQVRGKQFPRMMVARKPGRQGERVISRKTIA